MTNILILKKQKNMDIIRRKLYKKKKSVMFNKAFSKIFVKNSKSRLILIGEGPEKKNCEDLCVKLKINNRVDFLGNIKNVKYHLKSLHYL